MTITTIYNPGDEVWVLIDNKIAQVKILRIYSALTDEDGTPIAARIQWELDVDEPSMWMNCSFRARRPESKLFKTKEELIASLT